MLTVILLSYTKTKTFPNPAIIFYVKTHSRINDCGGNLWFNQNTSVWFSICDWSNKCNWAVLLQKHLFYCPWNRKSPPKCHWVSHGESNMMRCAQQHTGVGVLILFHAYVTPFSICITSWSHSLSFFLV